METNQDLTKTVEEMMAEMHVMRSEILSLKTRATSLTLPPPPVSAANPFTRRKALRKIGGGLVAASLGVSFPLFTTSAAPEQQVRPSSGNPNGNKGVEDPQVKP